VILEQTLENLISDDLLARHGITGLTPSAKHLFVASVMVAVQNRLSQRLLTSITPVQLQHLEALPESHKQHQLNHLAEQYGLHGWVQPELEAVLTQLTQNSPQSAS
jgi:hypothetical protein